MDLLQAWNLAQRRDAAFAASQANQQAEQEQVPQARAQLLPSIHALGTAELQERHQTSEFSQHRASQRAGWALTLSQSLFDRVAWEQLNQAQLQAQAADVQLAQARQTLMLQVSQAYFDVLAAQDSLQTLRIQAKAIQEQLNAAEQLFELGGSTITDSYEAQSRLDLLKAQTLEAQLQVQLAQDRLYSLTLEPSRSLAPLDRQATPPRPIPDDIETWSQQASTSGLEVARRELIAQALEKQVSAASSQHYPTLALKAQTGSASDQTLYGPQGGGPRSINSSVGLELSIPLYTGGRVSSQVREQSSRLQQARYEFQHARQQAIQQSRQYYTGVQTGLARIQALQAAEKSSQQALEANQLAYEVGVRINIDVLNAQQQLYETQRNLARARYDTLLDGLRLKASTGILSEADLQAINAMLKPTAQNTP